MPPTIPVARPRVASESGVMGGPRRVGVFGFAPEAGGRAAAVKALSGIPSKLNTRERDKPTIAAGPAPAGAPAGAPASSRIPTPRALEPEPEPDPTSAASPPMPDASPDSVGEPRGVGRADKGTAPRDAPRDTSSPNPPDRAIGVRSVYVSGPATPVISRLDPFGLKNTDPASSPSSPTRTNTPARAS